MRQRIILAVMVTAVGLFGMFYFLPSAKAAQVPGGTCYCSGNATGGDTKTISPYFNPDDCTDAKESATNCTYYPPVKRCCMATGVIADNSKLIQNYSYPVMACDTSTYPGIDMTEITTSNVNSDGTCNVPQNHCICKTKDNTACTEKSVGVLSTSNGSEGIICGAPATDPHSCQVYCASLDAPTPVAGSTGNWEVLACVKTLEERDTIYNTSIATKNGCGTSHCWCKDNVTGDCIHETRTPKSYAAAPDSNFGSKDMCAQYCDSKNPDGVTAKNWTMLAFDQVYNNYYDPRLYPPGAKNSCAYVTPAPKINPYDYTSYLRKDAQGLNQVSAFKSPQAFVGQMIRVILSLVGALALVLYIYSGLMWMTAAGNAERSGKAKQIIVWVTLGLVVMLSSYVLVNFLFGSVLLLDVAP